MRSLPITIRSCGTHMSCLLVGACIFCFVGIRRLGRSNDSVFSRSRRVCEHDYCSDLFQNDMCGSKLCLPSVTGRHSFKLPNSWRMNLESDCGLFLPCLLLYLLTYLSVQSTHASAPTTGAMDEARIPYVPACAAMFLWVRILQRDYLRCSEVRTQHQSFGTLILAVSA